MSCTILEFPLHASQEPKPSGIVVDILKCRGDSWSNGGISASYDQALLVLPGGGPFKPQPELPAITIEQHFPGCLRARVLGLEGHPMMGGCYVASSDARFGELCRLLLGHAYYGAVPLHDRYEGVSR